MVGARVGCLAGGLVATAIAAGPLHAAQAPTGSTPVSRHEFRHPRLQVAQAAVQSRYAEVQLRRFIPIETIPLFDAFLDELV